MPFALVGFFIGIQHAQQPFDAILLLQVILCMVFARSAAMAFNRYADKDIDRQNPRTAEREIPAGTISPSNALFFVIVNAMLFMVTTYFINELCFYLSPIALAVILGYSYTKRFTALCHFVLGVGLSLAPLGAYLAVIGSFDSIVPILFSGIVLFWVAGFDIIYALQDEDFDRTLGLHSIPSYLGVRRSIILSIILHLATAFLIIYAAYSLQANIIHWIGASAFICLLAYQHYIVRPHDLSNVNLAFFTTNGIASILYASTIIADYYFPL